MRVLGVLLDDKLSYTFHINKIISSVNFTLRRLYSLNVYLPFQIRCKVAHALLMSQISYCLEIYSCTSYGNIRKVELLINKVIRFVFSLRVRDHITGHVIRFLGCNFSNFLNIKILMSFYKLIKNSTPSFLVRRFEFMHSSRNMQIFIPRIYNSFFERSVLVRVARVWNHLPPRLRNYRLSPYTYHKALIEYFNTV